MTRVMLAKSPRNQLASVLFTHGYVDRKSSPFVSAGPALASSLTTGAMLRRLFTNDSFVWFTVDVAIALNLPSASIAFANLVRESDSTASACGIVVSALSTV